MNPVDDLHAGRPGHPARRDGLHHPDDEHYRLWREEHARQLDADYRAWCEQRYQRFCSEFDRWRAEHHGRQHLYHETGQDPTPDETPSLSIGP